MIPFIIIAIFSKLIASAYGPSFVKLPLVLNVCIFTAVISSMTNVLTQDLIAHNQNWYLFWTRLIRDSFTLVIAYLAIRYVHYQASAIYATAVLSMQTFYLINLMIKRKQLYKKK